MLFEPTHRQVEVRGQDKRQAHHEAHVKQLDGQHDLASWIVAASAVYLPEVAESVQRRKERTIQPASPLLDERIARLGHIGEGNSVFAEVH